MMLQSKKFMNISFPSIDADCDHLCVEHVHCGILCLRTAARFRLQAKVDSKKQKQKLALLNGNATAPPAIEAAKTAPEPDNRSVEDILAFLGEDAKPSASNGGKKGGKGKKSKGAAKSHPDAPKSDPLPSNDTKDSSKHSPNPSSTMSDSVEHEETTSKAEASNPIESQKESSSSPRKHSIISTTDKVLYHDPLVDEPRVLKKSLNLSASSDTSSASASSYGTVPSSLSSSTHSLSPNSLLNDDHPSEPKSALNAPIPAHLTFPSMATLPTSIPPSPQLPPQTTMVAPIQATPLSSSGSLPTFPSTQALPAFPPHTHLQPPQHHAIMNVTAPTMAPTAPVYQPIQIFFPPAPSVGAFGAVPPGLDLPPGLNVMKLNGEAPLRSSGGAISDVGIQPASTPTSLYYPSTISPHIAPIHTPQQRTSPQQPLSVSHLLTIPDSSFAIETSSFPLPPLTSSSSSAQYYWGIGDEEDDEKSLSGHSGVGAIEDPDFELELAQFRQSLELGIRYSSPSTLNAMNTNFAATSEGAGTNAAAAALRQQTTSSTSSHSTTTGNRPVGAY